MIICFSGTGNSLKCALVLKEALPVNWQSLTMISSQNLASPSVTLAAAPDEPVIWIFPTYSWGVPPIVLRFLEICTCTRPDALHHAVVTYGDDAGNLASQWHRRLQRKNLTPGGVYGIRMPNTYTLMKGFDTDPSDIVKEKLAAIPARIAEIAKAIKAGSTLIDITAGKHPWIKTAIIYPYFTRMCMSPRPFHPTTSCVGCGRCALSCPLSNIKMEADLPHWGNNCALCLRCYHICPHHAVAYGKATKGKGQYLCPDVQLPSPNKRATPGIAPKSV